MRRRALLIFAVIFAVLVVITKGASLYTDWLWFNELSFRGVFLTVLLSDIGIRVVIGLFVFLFLLANLSITRNKVLEASSAFEDDDVITINEAAYKNYFTPNTIKVIFLAMSVLLALFFAASVSGVWVILQQFLHPTPFNIIDPIFGKDLGFYVFQLPFWQFLYRVISAVVVLTLVVVAVIYFVTNSAVHGRLIMKILAPGTPRNHLAGLLALFFAIRAWGYRIDQYLLLYSTDGAVFGAGYVETNAMLLALKALLVLSLLAAVAVIIGALRNRYGLLLWSVGLIIVASFALGGIYPGLVQKFVVEPNEMEKELPYIEYNIDYTRSAYNLDTIERENFPAGRTLTAQDIVDNDATIQNIRLWDWEPLQETYSQLQELRQYYEMKNLDIDRYTIDGKIRQVMLAARELDQTQISERGKTWVNEKLVYTHGYGVIMSPVNEVNPEGLPEFFLKDIPPVSVVDEFDVTRPEIYYGEIENNPVIVKAKSLEFDYPMGEDNVMGTYEGDGGVPLDSFMKRIMFTLSFSDYRLLFASDITNDSYIMYHRTLKERVPRIAPFLQYDDDPYLAVSDGKLYWIWDAYTTSSMYPYSERFNNFHNYIRNSVKVIVDAYNGDVTFYVSDPDDPVIQTFGKVFPGVFRPLDEMTEDLRSHLRYPEGLFKIQAQLYTDYHMTNPRVFYNKEDRWNLPTEIYMGSEEIPMDPYYAVINLPGEDEPEFVLIMPFTPQNRKNMISWIAARSDGEHYGKLLVYEFPKQEIIYGPMQIEARINQDAEIAPQITLWDQRGARVLRGNLLIIPIKDSLLYVEPLFLQAEQSRLPELRRVIVAHGDKIVMEPTLEASLQKLFGSDNGPLTPDGDIQEPSGDVVEQDILETLEDLIDEANKLYRRAEEKLKAGDWAGYGTAWNELKDVLSRLQSFDDSLRNVDPIPTDDPLLSDDPLLTDDPLLDDDPLLTDDPLLNGGI